MADATDDDRVVAPPLPSPNRPPEAARFAPPPALAAAEGFGAAWDPVPGAVVAPAWLLPNAEPVDADGPLLKPLNVGLDADAPNRLAEGNFAPTAPNILGPEPPPPKSPGVDLA